MNILITGGAGYVGTELTYALGEDASVNQVVVYDNLIRNNHNLFLGKSKLNTNKIRFVHGDILDSQKLKKEVEMADIVYHLAAKVTTPFADYNPHEFDQINNWGTAELTYLVEQSKVSKIIYASSVSVYGASHLAVDNVTLANPKTFYGISKMHGEEHINRLQNSGAQVYVLRLGNVFGYSKSMRFDSVINKFMFDANFTNRLRIFGDGNQMRSFIHIDLLTTILKKVGFSDLKPGTYNLVENTFAINEIVNELKYLYPSLEMIYVNQNMKMRSLKVKSELPFTNSELIQNKSLKTDLEYFKTNFSF